MEMLKKLKCLLQNTQRKSSKATGFKKHENQKHELDEEKKEWNKIKGRPDLIDVRCIRGTNRNGVAPCFNVKKPKNAEIFERLRGSQ